MATNRTRKTAKGGTNKAATKRPATKKSAAKRVLRAASASPTAKKRPTTTGAKTAARKVAAKRTAPRKVAARSALRRPAAKPALKAAGKTAARPAGRSTAAPLPPSFITLARVLDALHAQTGNNGGTHAAESVRRYRDNNGDVDDETALFVRALPIKNWFVDPDKPSADEIDDLWIAVLRKMARPETSNPGGWGGASSTSTLNRIAREATS